MRGVLTCRIFIPPIRRIPLLNHVLRRFSFRPISLFKSAVYMFVRKSNSLLSCLFTYFTRPRREKQSIPSRVPHWYGWKVLTSWVVQKKPVHAVHWWLLTGNCTVQWNLLAKFSFFYVDQHIWNFQIFHPQTIFPYICLKIESFQTLLSIKAAHISNIIITTNPNRIYLTFCTQVFHTFENILAT